MGRGGDGDGAGTGGRGERGGQRGGGPERSAGARRVVHADGGVGGTSQAAAREGNGLPDAAGPDALGVRRPARQAGDRRRSQELGLPAGGAAGAGGAARRRG